MDDLTQQLKELATTPLLSERCDGLIVDDYAGGNVNNAYKLGLQEGAILHAREMLEALRESASSTEGEDEINHV